jgi:hypothetical protein
MRESELERGLGALVPHNLSGVRWKALETELAALVLGDRKLVMRFMTN